MTRVRRGGQSLPRAIEHRTAVLSADYTTLLGRSNELMSGAGGCPGRGAGYAVFACLAWTALPGTRAEAAAPGI